MALFTSALDIPKSLNKNGKKENKRGLEKGIFTHHMTHSPLDASKTVRDPVSRQLACAIQRQPTLETRLVLL